VIVGSGLTLIVDSGIHDSAAATILGYAEAVAKAPGTMLVNTEQHLDHIGGNAFFHARGIESHGHPAIRRSEADLDVFKSEYKGCIANASRRDRGERELFFGGTRIENPLRPLSNGQHIDLGCARVTVHFVPGHTPSNIALFVLPDRVLFSGDTIVNGYVPNLESGQSQDWRQWLESLSLLEALEPAPVVPGHGALIEGPARIGDEVARIRSVLLAAIDSGVAPTAP